MKSLSMSLFLVLILQTNVHAVLLGGPGQCMGLTGPSSTCLLMMTTTSLPTLLIENEKVDYNSNEGKAFLIQEATNVLDGKKSLIIKDDDKNIQNAKTAIEKAQIILDNLNK